jgi:hypothetical protein
MKIYIPSTIRITQAQIAELLETYTEECIEEQLEAYARWKEGKKITSDIACFRKFLSNLSQETTTTTTPNEGKPKYFLRKEQGWVLVEKHADYEIICPYDGPEPEWRGCDIPYKESSARTVKREIKNSWEEL